jgi:DNA polymerase-3 subunit beta
MPTKEKSGPSGMEISIDKNDVLKELSVAQGAVDRKTPVPILFNVLLEAQGDELSITSTDLDLSLRTSCVAKVIRPGSCTVPARKLYDYVRLLGDGRINMKLLDNFWVQLRSGHSNTKMVGMATENFPKVPLFPASTSIQLPAPTLRTLIAKTMFAISQEESRYTLNGALLLIKPESMTMVSTDGHRLAHVETVNTKIAVAEQIRILVPKKAVAEIGSLLSSMEADIIEFAKDESTLFFRIGPRLLTSRQLSGQFPNYEAILPTNLDQSIVLPVDELSRAIQRVSQFADERSNAIRLKFEGNQLRIKSSCSETGESEDLIDATYSGQELTMGFNSRYLMDFLRVAGPGNVAFSFKADNLPGEFRPEENADFKYRYIVMPVRV